MKSETELINQIRKLNGIKPDQDWVVSAKFAIMGQEALERNARFAPLSGLIFRYRIAFAGIMMVGLAGGSLAVSQNALPGEPLYGVKKAAERGMALIGGQDNNAAANLQLVARRLEEIDLLSQKNLVKNLPAAFYEYKTAKAAAKKEVAALVAQNPENAGAIVKEAGAAMKNISEKEKQVYGVLGLDQNASSTDDGIEAVSDKMMVESLLDYFQKNTVLTEEQNNDLSFVRKEYEAGNYGQAIDYYLSSSLNR